uniref:Uncharacterized protein n=1 Tax=Plectus sambesii TaxID=2011161 RepID=A0A914WYW2_9BILA
MSGHRSSQRSSSHRRSKTAEEGSSAVRHSSRSLHDGVSAAHDSLSQYTNEAAGPSDRQPRRHHHHRSASCRHRSHRSSSSVRRQSKRKDVADGSEPIDDLSRPLDQGPVADPSEQQDARQ